MRSKINASTNTSRIKIDKTMPHNEKLSPDNQGCASTISANCGDTGDIFTGPIGDVKSTDTQESNPPIGYRALRYITHSYIFF
jgi:hypothetical protein